MSAEVLELRGDIDLNEKPKVAAQLTKKQKTVWQKKGIDGKTLRKK